MNESIYLAGHEWHRIYEYTPFNGQVEMLQFNVDLVCSLVATPNKLFVLTKRGSYDISLQYSDRFFEFAGRGDTTPFSNGN